MVRCSNYKGAYRAIINKYEVARKGRAKDRRIANSRKQRNLDSIEEREDRQVESSEIKDSQEKKDKTSSSVDIDCNY